MTASELIGLVEAMRRLQRDFYSYKVPEHRPPGLLGQCKAAESRVDRALKEYREAQRPGLFDRERED
jgi:hypothetical protein